VLQSVAHIALIVRDYDEAIAWFTGVLGFTLVDDTYQPEQDKRWVLVAPPGAGDNAATSSSPAAAETVSTVAFPCAITPAKVGGLMDLASTAGVTTLSHLYGFASSAAQFAVNHIETLKQADSAVANRCGQVLEAANEGFGVGSETALVLIGVGQSLLGNPLTGSVTVAAGTNPIVMTCAAIGAIHYGWNAMSEKEREVLLRTVSDAFAVGVELVRSIARFAVDMIKALMSAENIAELKKMVADVAAAFGTRLSEITRALTDRIREGSRYVAGAAGGGASTVWSYVPSFRSAQKEPPAGEENNQQQA
jgi:catechol 2,3-dioxygenase-like lactoylglutathione lyase family enzyme